MMQFGMDRVFVGSGIFKSEDPITMAKAVVEATAHFNDAKLVGDVSRNVGESMPGLEESSLETGWQNADIKNLLDWHKQKRLFDLSNYNNQNHIKNMSFRSFFLGNPSSSFVMRYPF